MSDNPDLPKEAPKWRPDAEDGGIEAPLVEETPASLTGDFAGAVAGTVDRSGYDRWSGELAGERPVIGQPVIPYQPGADYRGAPGVAYTGPTAPGAGVYQPGTPPPPYGAPAPPYGAPAPPYGAPAPPDGAPPATPPPYGSTPPPPGAPPPYRPPIKKKSNKGMIITLVVTIVVLIAAVGAWGMMRGFKRLQSDFGDSAAQSLVRDALSLEERYYTSNKRFANATELGTGTGSTPRPRNFVETDPQPPGEVKVITDGDNIVCITARSAGGTYWAAGVIAANGAKSTYYLDNQFSDPLSVCGSDSIKAGRKGGFPSPTRR